MRVRLLTIAAAIGVAAAVIPAHAAGTTTATLGKPLTFTDPSGDANFINGQGLEDNSVPSQSTPSDMSSADITEVSLQSIFQTTTTTKTVTTVVKKKKVKKTVDVVTSVPSGTLITMTLAAAPGNETNYRIKLTVPGCASTFYIELSTDQVLGGTVMRCGNTSVTATFPDAVVKGSTITWTVPLTVIPAGAKLTGIGAGTEVNPAVVTAPQYDEASTAATFTVGQP